ncbi:hypothetical protein FNU76_11795 [Chitinimonas arctica]|uniref:Lipoprotein n=1 Tax=Chitinimonas arctica TaxID=2594795 RepID=A0A516SFX3_9NEIS|nr:hypothetical protein [Chitinimonas arctica]QDQ26990.1 hypothetical protein FNU76_11795 [Chitinimonas arctica]
MMPDRSISYPPRARGPICGLLCALILTGAHANAAAQADICGNIKKIFQSGKYPQYAIPFEQIGLDHVRYEFDLDKNGIKEYLEATCGHSSDAQCDMNLTMNGKQGIQFSLPVGIRLLEINNRVYIVNGISIYGNGKVEWGNYTVHGVSPKRLRVVCK